MDGHADPSTLLLVVPAGTDTLQRPSHRQGLFTFDQSDQRSGANVRTEHRNMGGRVMTNVRAGLVAAIDNSDVLASGSSLGIPGRRDPMRSASSRIHFGHSLDLFE